MYCIMLLLLIFFPTHASAMMREKDTTLRDYFRMGKKELSYDLYRDSIQNNDPLALENTLKIMKLAKIDLPKLLNSIYDSYGCYAFQQYGEKADQVIKLLIQYGYDVNHYDNVGHGRLVNALMYGSEIQELEFLVRYGAQLRNQDGSTALLINSLYHKNSLEKIKLILQYMPNLDVNAKDSNERTCLHYANSPEMITFLKEAGANFSVQDNGGKTPIHYIVDNIGTETKKNEVFYEIIKMLAENGVDINAQKHEKGATALHLAKDIETMKVLIKLKAETELWDAERRTPIFTKVQEDNLELVRCFIECKSELYLQDINEETLLFHVKSLPMLKLLLRHPALRKNINKKNRSGETVLSSMIHRRGKKMLELIKYLLNNGADINATYYHKELVKNVTLEIKDPERLQLLIAANCYLESCPTWLTKDLMQQLEEQAPKLALLLKKVWDYASYQISWKIPEEPENIELDLCFFTRAIKGNYLRPLNQFINLRKDYAKFFNWKSVLECNPKSKLIFHILAQLNVQKKDLEFLWNKDSTNHNAYFKALYLYNKAHKNQEFCNDMKWYGLLCSELQEKQISEDLIPHILSYYPISSE